MQAHIVVGMGYGDEGKGITTDYLCVNTPSPIVVRFSGGQQAGHTVRIGSRIHTHSNFGAGTLRGYPSYFSEHTTFYPLHIQRERELLMRTGNPEPKLIIHPLAKLTTPFDIFANKICRDNLDHGTCGKGIGKTMKRNESPCKLYAIDLTNEDLLMNKLSSISDWYGDRLTGIDAVEFDAELEAFMDSIKSLKVTIADYDYLRKYHSVIFEGSQGVLLDMDHGNFPFVTYSNTTSKNAQEICDKLDIKDRTVYHVTRAYHTRHGNGFFEEEEITLVNNGDENNVDNKFQGKFKYAKMNYDYLNYAVAVDDIYSCNSAKVLVVTCNDQVMSKDKFDITKVNRTYNRVLKSFSSDSKDFEVAEPVFKF